MNGRIDTDDEFSSTDVLLTESGSRMDEVSFDSDEEVFEASSQAWLRCLNERAVDVDYVRFNKAQLLLQNVLSSIRAIAPVVVVQGMLEANDNIGSIASPYKQVITSITILGSKLALDTIRELTTAERPLDYLREAGNESVLTGFGRAGRTKVLATFPVLTASLIYGASLQAICQQAEQDQNMDNLMVCYMLSASLMNNMIIGVPASIVFAITEKLIGCCSPLPAKKAAEKPATRFYQDGAYFVFRAGNSFMQAEMLHELSLLFSPDLMHATMAPMLPILVDQLNLMLNYLAYQPRPFENIVPRGCGPQNDDDPFGERQGLLDDLSASHARRAKSLGARSLVFYSLSTAATLAVIGVTNYMLISHVAEDGDQEEMDASKRRGYSALLMMGGILLNSAINNAPGVIHAAPRQFSHAIAWCKNLSIFSRQGQESVNAVREMVPSLNFEERSSLT